MKKIFLLTLLLVIINANDNFFQLDTNENKQTTEQIENMKKEKIQEGQYLLNKEVSTEEIKVKNESEIKTYVDTLNEKIDDGKKYLPSDNSTEKGNVMGIRLYNGTELQNNQNKLQEPVKKINENIHKNQLAKDTYEEFKKNNKIQDMKKEYQTDIWKKMQDLAKEKNNNFSGTGLDSLAQALDNAVKEDHIFSKRIYIFISDSLPEKTIEEYLKISEGIGEITFVIRGVIESDSTYMQPTIKWMAKKLCGKESLKEVKTGDCKAVTISIDPIAFDKMNISQVPAIAFVKTPEKMIECTDMLNENDYIVAYGDANLEYIIEKMYLANPSLSDLGKILSKIQNNKVK